MKDEDDDVADDIDDDREDDSLVLSRRPGEDADLGVDGTDRRSCSVSWRVHRLCISCSKDEEEILGV